jgi:hypothetical protein
MKYARVLLACSALILLAATAYAECVNPPLDGTYTTMAGTILGGRSSEAWCSGEGPGRPGNTENAQSWDGAILGGQWKVYGMVSEGAVETARYFDAYGNGWIDYATNYTGGVFWLTNAAPWGGGAAEYWGTVKYFNVGARVNYAGWSPIGVTSNILMTGDFDACPNCAIQYAISNAILVWQTGYPTPMLADYPAFLCGATSGEQFDACCIIMKVMCNPVSTDESSWGSIKDLFRN